VKITVMPCRVKLCIDVLEEPAALLRSDIGGISG
jgi:hypothetical protein